MRKLLPAVFLLLMASPLLAQGHQATITWKAAPDAVASSAYNVYRAPGACPATSAAVTTWTLLTTKPVTVLNYTDTTITVGAWCYSVTQVQNGLESVKSAPAGGTANPNTVTTTVVVTQ